jgi:aspartyl-tRNA(Asn)/glutamyl-tRNA(Gln) amidotransferase subunit A
MLENHVPIYDAHVWQLLKQEGAVLLGKGNMDEFAMGSTCETSYFGGALNPRNTDHVAGGSSGGGASAVAGGLAVYAIGSDTGGSIRQPASFCGLVGLKPTYGAVSRRGLIAYASSFDQIGPITSCVEDAATVLDAITAADPMDMTHKSRPAVSPLLRGDVKGMKIGVAHEFFQGLNPDVKLCLEKAIDSFRNMGAEIIDVSFPLLKYSLPTYYILACAEASSNLGRYDGIRFGYKTGSYSTLDEMICLSRSEGFGAEVRRRILLGTYVLSAGYFDAYYKKAQKLRASITDEFSKILSQCDCIITPTVPVTAMKRGSNMSPVEMYQSDICTVSVNIAGVPAVSVPCGFDSSGLPVGMQLIGGHFREDVILNAALAFERESDGCYIKDSTMGVKL